jgi:hypothetical protein
MTALLVLFSVAVFIRLEKDSSSLIPVMYQTCTAAAKWSILFCAVPALFSLCVACVSLTLYLRANRLWCFFIKFRILKNAGEKCARNAGSKETFKFYFVFTQKSLHACMSFWLDQMSIIIDVVFAAFSQNSSGFWLRCANRGHHFAMTWTLEKWTTVVIFVKLVDMTCERSIFCDIFDAAYINSERAEDDKI